MMTPGKLIERTKNIRHVAIDPTDRDQMAIGLFLQGHTAGNACQIAYVELDDTDGALQMIARVRLCSSTPQTPPDAGIGSDGAGERV